MTIAEKRAHAEAVRAAEAHLREGGQHALADGLRAARGALVDALKLPADMKGK